MAEHPKGAIWLLLDSSGMGGIETHVYQLARALKEAGHAVQVRFYADYGPHPLRERLQGEGFEVGIAGGSFGSLLALVKAEQPALIHTHGYKAGILGRMSALLTRTPVVSTYHAGEPGAGIVRIYNWLDKLSAPLCGGLIAVSDVIAQQLPSRTRVINNFVPVTGQSGQSPDDIAFVGRLSPEKGPDRFCKIAALCPEQPFALYGDGPMMSALKPGPENVAFHGPQDGMDHVWPKVGLLCISSRNEGLPMAALEAMASGIPVASFELGALPGLIQNDQNGWIVPLNDLDAMAAVIRKWAGLPHDQKAAMSANAVNTIRKAYSPEAVLPEVLDVYRQAGFGKKYNTP